MDALRELTEHQRVAVLLVHGHEYRLNEAAEIIDVSVSTLRNHLERGLKNFARTLELRMNLSEETTGAGDEPEVMHRLKKHGAAVEGALPPLSGAEIREEATLVATTTVVGRSRTPFLVAAAAVVAIGGLAAYRLNRSTNAQQVGAAAELEADQPVATTPSTTPGSEDTTEEATAEVATSEGSTADMIPIPVEAADFGPPALRYRPAADSGFAVATGEQILLSEAQLFPPVAIPTRVQRVTMRAADPADRRGIAIMVSTYADAAAADLVVEAEPVQHGVSGDPMDLTGAQGNDIQGMRAEEEGFAPYSAGNPMRTIASARVRIGDAIVVDIGAADVSRAEVEALLASPAFDDDGALAAPTPPTGFSSSEPIEGPSVALATGSDLLGLSMVGVNGEEVEMQIFDKTAGDTTTSQLSTGVEGWVETGLFGQSTVAVVGSDAVFLLTNFDGQVSEAELIALAADGPEGRRHDMGRPPRHRTVVQGSRHGMMSP